MKVFVAGHRGMLGHVVARYLSENGCEVIASQQRYSASPGDPLIEEIRDSGCPWVVNALGKIKQKCQDSAILFESNSLFPLHLSAQLRRNQRLIHASTDCVFSGRTGDYSVESDGDPEDHYGLSKLLGERIAEPGRTWVMRASVIGPETSGHAGLMSWFLSQTGSVSGFVNHRWNGITTLEWSKVCLELMNGTQTSNAPIWHVGVRPTVTKYELLQLIGAAWDHRIQIEPREAQTKVDRSLKLTCVRQPIAEQLSELRNWYADRGNE